MHILIVGEISKIRYDFNDLSEEERSQLISELFVYVSSERKGGFEIQNKICITIASLALKWRQFKNFVPIIIEKMGVLDNKYMLLSTLSYLPEEISNKSVCKTKHTTIMLFLLFSFVFV